MKTLSLTLVFLFASVVSGQLVTVTDTHITTPTDTVPRFVPPNPTTYSIQNGNWGDSSTWANGRVPQTGDTVRVTHTVTYDVHSGTKLDAVEVSGGGILQFSTGITSPTRMCVNEIQILPDGTWIQGQLTDPVLSKSTVEFTDTPQADGHHFKTGTVSSPGIDPSQYGNGLMCWGKFTACGVDVTDYLQLAIPTGATNYFGPAAGESVLTLEDIPSNWSPGDRLCIGDTRVIRRVDDPGYYVYEPQHEELEISSVSGNLVTLVVPLQYDHFGGREDGGNGAVSIANGKPMLPHVGNLTRSVVFRSENPDGVRGHTQFFARAEKEVRNVQFENLGRTKGIPIDNTTIVNGTVTHIGTNQIGRYSDHNHHLWGPESGGIAGTQYQVIEIGNSYDGGLKWQLTIHNTHYGLFEDLVLYHGHGSGLATEDGSETGNIIRNSFACAQRAGTVSATNENDKGDQGDGFWLAGGNNTTTGLIAADCHRNAFTIFPVAAEVTIPAGPGQVPSIAQQITEQVALLTDLQAYGCESAISIWEVGNVNEHPGITENLVKDMIAWNLFWAIYTTYNTPVENAENVVYRGKYGSWSGSRSSGRTEVTTGFRMSGARSETFRVKNCDVQGMYNGFLDRGRGAAEGLIVENCHTDWNYIDYEQIPFGRTDMVLRDCTFGTNSPIKLRKPWVPPSVATRTILQTFKIYNFNGTGIDYQLYYEQQEPDYLVPNGSCPCGDGKTNQECWDTCGVSVGGEVAPVPPGGADAKALMRTLSGHSNAWGMAVELGGTPPPPVPTATLSVSPASIPEDGITQSQVTVTLSETTTVIVTVNLQFTGTASATDYATSANQITIDPGQLIGSIGIIAADDSFVEPDETVITSISTVTNASIGGNPVTTTIIDDDDPPQVWVPADLDTPIDWTRSDLRVRNGQIEILQ